MQLYQLEQFRVLAHYEHMTQAAEHLGISQPALSRSIARLEAEIGVPLFDRRGRGIALNPLGREYLRFIDSAFRQIDDGRRFIGDMFNAGARRVRMMDNGYRIIGAALLRRHMDAHPNIAVEHIVDLRGEELTLPVANADVWLTTVEAAGGDMDWMPLTWLELHLLVPNDAPYQADADVALAEFAGMRFVGPVRGCESREVFEQLCHDAGFSPRFTYEGTDVSLATASARTHRGALYSFGVPSVRDADPTAQWAAARGFTRLRVRDLPQDLQLGIAAAKDRAPDSAASGVVGTARALFAGSRE